jgi:polyisoprenoid-binding protein YceI
MYNYLGETMSIDVATTTGLRAGTWTIDPSHSEVGFTARHLMSKVRGLFERFEGQIVIGEDTSASATIDLNSINTRDEQRDGHLRSKDFFDVENSGPLTFQSSRIEEGGRGFLVTGDLTIKGVTRPVTLDVEYFGTETDPWGGTRAGFEGTTEISRKDFGVDFQIPMDGGRFLVGDTISILVAVQAVLQQEQ